MNKKCLKCDYVRQDYDRSPEYECPRCGVVYEKYEAKLALEKKKAALLKQEEEEKAALKKQEKAKIDKERALKKRAEKAKRERNRSLPAIVTKTYEGKQHEAALEFKKDAQKMAEKGYRPTTQNWSQGTWGCGSFIMALFLCFIVIGVLIFIYMLIVKPAGTLTVTYELREINAAATSPSSEVGDTATKQKECPQCAETVKAAAKICRYCRYQFET